MGKGSKRIGNRFRNWPAITVLLGVAIILSLGLAACSSTTGGSSSTTSASDTTATTSNSGQSTTSVAPEATKTLKIGHAENLSAASGMEMIKALRLMADQVNEAGGVLIGSDRYKIELVELDLGTSQTSEMAAINKAIYQDKIQYLIVGGATTPNAWLPVLEQNKVMTLLADIGIQWQPTYRYTFDASGFATATATMTGWFASKYPEEIKNLVLAFPDNQFGHMIDGMLGSAWNAFGAKPTTEFFPESSQDLSSLATKVVSLSPGVFTAISGQNATDALVYNAVRQAGYTGLFFSTTSASFAALSAVMSPANLEGFISCANAFEFDPPVSQSAADFKDAWVKEYGEWTSPDIAYSANFQALITALEKAGTTDVDKVAAALGGGMQYETVFGTGQMIGNSTMGTYTVDSVLTNYVKQIVNGKVTLLATILPDEALGYVEAAQQAAPPAPPGP
jgi:branched-chain amino acid transport system substrate-binding protein